MPTDGISIPKFDALPRIPWLYLSKLAKCTYKSFVFKLFKRNKMPGWEWCLALCLLFS